MSKFKRAAEESAEAMKEEVAFYTIQNQIYEVCAKFSGLVCGLDFRQYNTPRTLYDFAGFNNDDIAQYHDYTTPFYLRVYPDAEVFAQSVLFLTEQPFGIVVYTTEKETIQLFTQEVISLAQEVIFPLCKRFNKDKVFIKEENATFLGKRCRIKGNEEIVGGAIGIYPYALLGVNLNHETRNIYPWPVNNNCCQRGECTSYILTVQQPSLPDTPIFKRFCVIHTDLEIIS